MHRWNTDYLIEFPAYLVAHMEINSANIYIYIYIFTGTSCFNKKEKRKNVLYTPRHAGYFMAVWICSRVVKLYLCRTILDE